MHIHRPKRGGVGVAREGGGETLRTLLSESPIPKGLRAPLPNIKKGEGTREVPTQRKSGAGKKRQRNAGPIYREFRKKRASASCCSNQGEKGRARVCSGEKKKGRERSFSRLGGVKNSFQRKKRLKKGAEGKKE